MVQPLYRAVADKRHPITRKLTEVFGGRLTANPSSRVVKAHGEKGASPRQEIVSEKLIGRSSSIMVHSSVAISNAI